MPPSDGFADLTRLVIELGIGPRTPQTALALLASVAMCCHPVAPLTILADARRPYPQAILKIPESSIPDPFARAGGPA